LEDWLVAGSEMLCIYVGVGLFAWVVLEVFL
jgi:hypothetical protein